MQASRLHSYLTDRQKSLFRGKYHLIVHRLLYHVIYIPSRACIYLFERSINVPSFPIYPYPSIPFQIDVRILSYYIGVWGAVCQCLYVLA